MIVSVKHSGVYTGREKREKIVPGILEKTQEFPGFLKTGGNSDERKRNEA